MNEFRFICARLILDETGIAFTQAVNNAVNKLILDSGSCENLHKKLRFADPVFITPGIRDLLRLQTTRCSVTVSNLSRWELYQALTRIPCFIHH